MKAVIAALAVAAAVLGLAGGSMLLLERRLAGLTPGGVEADVISYNPFSGRLLLANLRARDGAGREVLRADSVLATASPLGLLGSTLSLGRVRVVAPHLTLRADAGFDLDDLAAGLGAAHAFFGRRRGVLPLSLDDLLVVGGSVTIDGAGEDGLPLRVRDLDVRLSRLTTARADDQDMAFAVEMAVYGTLVYITGQPRGGGYAVHVRARGLDAPALLRDFSSATVEGPAAAVAGIERGRADVDVDVLLAAGHALASGYVKLADAVATLPVPGAPRLRSTVASIAVDGFDLAAGTGRITRIDLSEPSLSLPVASAHRALVALAESLGGRPGLLVRRVAITDGALTLQGEGGVRLERLQLAAQMLERRADAPWSVSARVALGADAEVSVDGLVTRDLRSVDAITHLQRVPLAPWRALAGGWDARVSFDGRVRVVASEGETLATAVGQAQLDEVTASSAGGFSAERIALTIKRLRWPMRDVVLDRVVVTRPAFGPAALATWPASMVTNGVSVVDGEMRAEGAGRALHRVDLDLAADGVGRSARLKLSAATDSGRVDVDRVVSATGAAALAGVPLNLLAAALDEAARTPADTPSALPSAVFQP